MARNAAAPCSSGNRRRPTAGRPDSSCLVVYPFEYRRRLARQASDCRGGRFVTLDHSLASPPWRATLTPLSLNAVAHAVAERPAKRSNAYEPLIFTYAHAAAR